MTPRQRPACRPAPSGRVLITGGAGFIGTNLADRLARRRARRASSSTTSRGPASSATSRGCGDSSAIASRSMLGRRPRAAAPSARPSTASQQVFHFAAQVAVTTSLVEPLDDFDVNARGTLNVLEAIRARRSPPPLVFTSTNKVYGGLDDVAARRPARRATRRPIRRCRARRRRARGRSTSTARTAAPRAPPISTCSTTRARFGLPAVVFRMSCIYGPHQFGTEDQGWVAHFLIRALAGEPITLYGDGKQVRDVLYVDDLVEALLPAQRQMPALAGQAFNIGGGPRQHDQPARAARRIAAAARRALRRPHRRVARGRPALLRLRHRRFAEATGWRPQVCAAGRARAAGPTGSTAAAIRPTIRARRAVSWTDVDSMRASIFTGGEDVPSPGAAAAGRPRPGAGAGRGLGRVRVEPAGVGRAAVVQLSRRRRASPATRAGASSTRSAMASRRRCSASRVAFLSYARLRRVGHRRRGVGGRSCPPRSPDARVRASRSAAPINIFDAQRVVPGRPSRSSASASSARCSSPWPRTPERP